MSNRSFYCSAFFPILLNYLTIPRFYHKIVILLINYFFFCKIDGIMNFRDIKLF